MNDNTFLFRRVILMALPSTSFRKSSMPSLNLSSTTNPSPNSTTTKWCTLFKRVSLSRLSLPLYVSLLWCISLRVAEQAPATICRHLILFLINKYTLVLAFALPFSLCVNGVRLKRESNAATLILLCEVWRRCRQMWSCSRESGVLGMWTRRTAQQCAVEWCTRSADGRDVATKKRIVLMLRDRLVNNNNNAKIIRKEIHKECQKKTIIIV